MASRDFAQDVISGKFFVGLSSIIGLSLIAGQNSILVKYITGGSLEIGGATLTWGKGYLMDTGALGFNSVGSLYFAATGATVTVHYIKGTTAG